MFYCIVLGLMILWALAAGIRKGSLKPEVCLEGMAEEVARIFSGKKNAVLGQGSRVTENLRQLYPDGSITGVKRDYDVEKWKTILMVVLVGDVMTLFLWISSVGREEIVDNRYIQRKEQGQGSKTVYLTAKKENGEEIALEFSVQEKRYEDAELELLYEEMLEEVDRVVLGENLSWENITTDLCFVEEMENYPFTLTWSSDDYGLITGDGKVVSFEEMPEDSSGLVALTMRAEYFDYIKEYSFFAKVCPVKGEVTFEEALTEALQNAEEESPYEDSILLPVRIQGENIVWSAAENDSGQMIFFLSLTCAVGIFFLKDRDLQKQVQIRGQKIEAEYSAIISKLTLYLGAGMNLRGAWQKTAKEGGSTNPVYQEMQLTCREMDGGISEGEAYERFGKRVRQQRYIRLTTLLVQNLRKGNAALLFQLRQESVLALEDKAAAVKKSGEEAGTKMLFPMMLMMGMVMVFIIVPAFLSF